jgi:acetolactate synthase-1/2/3 large subunit
VPLILLVGQVAREELTRGAFQEVDYVRFFGGMVKGVYEVNEGRRLPEILSRSFRLATEGTAGPVVLSMPEDMLSDEMADFTPAVYPPARPGHGAADIAHIQDMIDQAERPIIVAGGLFRGTRGADALRRLADAQRVPVAVTWKNQDVFDNSSPLYAGHLGFGNPPAFRKALAEADLIIALGTRLGDVASLNYSFPEAPVPTQDLIHVYPDGWPIGRVFRTDFGLVADPVAVAETLAREAQVVSSGREAWISGLNSFIRSFQVFTSPDPDDGVDFGAVTMSLARQAPADAIITTDAGNMSTWVHRHWIMGPKNTLLGAVAGAMGYGVPAAVAASIAAPERTAICFVGDGGVLMTGQELATACHYGAAPKIVISDNGIYGTIRTHQEREYPGRVSGTDLVNPDFTSWAKSFGASVFSLKLGDNDLDGTVKAFLEAPGLAVLHVKSSKQALSAYGQLKPPA